jgi:hypothetical protein
MALEEPVIRSTDPNIPINNNCTDSEMLHGMPGGSGDFIDETDQRDERDAIPTASRQQRLATPPERLDVVTSGVDGDEGDGGNDADADVDKEEDASHADDGSTLNVED